MTERTKKNAGLGRYEQVETDMPFVKAYRSGKGCTIFVGQEPARKTLVWVPESARLLWHMSIAHRNRYPTWDEIADARYEFVPEEVTMAMLLPPPGEYVNFNENCFHLWEIEDPRA